MKAVKVFVIIPQRASMPLDYAQLHAHAGP